MELKNYKEIIIDGKIMKSLAANGKEIWNGVPDDVYLVNAGVNKTGKSWSASSNRLTQYWNYNGSVIFRVNSSPYSKDSWTVTPSGYKIDVTDFTKLNIKISQTQENRSGWGTSFYAKLGGISFTIPQGISSLKTLTFDISSITGEVSFTLGGTNYGDSNSINTEHDTKIQDIWLSAE